MKRRYWVIYFILICVLLVYGTFDFVVLMLSLNYDIKWQSTLIAWLYPFVAIFCVFYMNYLFFSYYDYSDYKANKEKIKLTFKSWKSFYELNPQRWYYTTRTISLFVKELYCEDYKERSYKNRYFSVQFNFIDYLKFTWLYITVEIPKEKRESKNTETRKDNKVMKSFLEQMQDEINQAYDNIRGNY